MGKCYFPLSKQQANHWGLHTAQGTNYNHLQCNSESCLWMFILHAERYISLRSFSCHCSSKRTCTESFQVASYLWLHICSPLQDYKSLLFPELIEQNSYTLKLYIYIYIWSTKVTFLQNCKCYIYFYFLLKCGNQLQIPRSMEITCKNSILNKRRNSRKHVKTRQGKERTGEEKGNGFVTAQIQILH